MKTGGMITKITGNDSIDHPAYGGSDDLANAVAGVIYLLSAGTYINTKQIVLVGERMTAGGPFGDFDNRPDW